MKRGTGRNEVIEKSRETIGEGEGSSGSIGCGGKGRGRFGDKGNGKGLHSPTLLRIDVTERTTEREETEVLDPLTVYPDNIFPILRY